MDKCLIAIPTERIKASCWGFYPDINRKKKKELFFLLVRCSQSFPDMSKFVQGDRSSWSSSVYSWVQ